MVVFFSATWIFIIGNFIIILNRSSGGFTMKLKTLKDIKKNNCLEIIREYDLSNSKARLRDTRWMDYKEIKAEAIKWYENRLQPMSDKDWVEFFNISEENLK